MMSPVTIMTLLLPILLLLLNLVPQETVGSRRMDRDCQPVSNRMRSKGFTYPWWNSTLDSDAEPDSEDSMSSHTNHGCPTGGPTAARSLKCCKSFASSATLMGETQAAFQEKWLGPKLRVQAKIFNDSKTRFDLTFKALLTRAHASFDTMFEKTYGMLYIQHAHVFHELFATFRAYYDNGKGSLDEKLNSFFSILTRKMFEVLNSQYDFNDAYLSCAAIVIGEQQGDELHRHIVSSLRRSFVATRALAQGLQDATAVLTSLQKLEAAPDCLLSTSQMLFCPICLEQRTFKPCAELCTKVSTGCLSPTMAMNRPWAEFLTAVEGVIDRLLGPYNVEAVVEPIHIKISEAIMNFQESGPTVSQAVFTKCGKPNLKSRNLRRKRDASAFSPTLAREPKAAESKSRSGSSSGRPRKPPSSEDDDHHGDDEDIQPHRSLEKLLRETKKKIQKTKSLWEKLPQQVCNGISKEYSSQMCWNGTALVLPDKNKSSDEVEMKQHPSAGGSGSRIGGPPNPLVNDQILVLQLITDKLRASYNGLDVQWVEEFDELDIGSGQGSGSGEVPPDLDDSDDDDPNGEIHGRKKYPARPSFPNLGGSPPLLFDGLPPGRADDDDDGDDDDRGRDNSVSMEENHIPGFGGGTGPGMGSSAGGGGGEVISTKVRKPVNNMNPSVVMKPSFDPPPGRPGGTPTSSGGDVSRNPTSGSSTDATTKTVAVFKLFTPIVLSMLGKLVSLS